MATEDGKAAVRRLVESEMSRHGWNQSDLAGASKTDPKTVSTFLNGTRWPSRATLAKIEAAFEDMRPGTLAALGEDQEPAWLRAPANDRAAGRASEADLLAELTHRVVGMKDEIERLREPAEEMLRLRARRQQYLAAHADDDDHHRSLNAQISALVSKSEYDSLSADEEAECSRLWDLVELAMLQAKHGIRSDAQRTRVSERSQAARERDAPRGSG